MRILQWDTLLLAYFANQIMSSQLLHQNTQVLLKPCQGFYAAEGLEVKDRKGSYNLKKKKCSGENIADVPLCCCESSCITSSECSCHAISACQERTAVWTQVGKGGTKIYCRAGYTCKSKGCCSCILAGGTSAASTSASLTAVNGCYSL